MGQVRAGDRDLMLSAIREIHAAALDEALWPAALKGVTELIGGVGASLEVMRKPTSEVDSWRGYGLPGAEAAAYVSHYAPTCRRTLYGARQAAGALIYEGLFTDEDEMRRDPFYMEFLALCDMHYFIGGSVRNDDRENVFVAVQRARSQGHVGSREIALYETILPHVQLSYDLMRRLEAAGTETRTLSEALEWLEDGVLVLARDGRVVKANAAADAMLLRDDGVAVRAGVVGFTAMDAHGAFLRALRAVGHAMAEPARPARLDFLAERAGGVAPYVVSLRPLPGRDRAFGHALMFIRDPLRSGRASPALLRRAFGLTAAQARLAAALADGRSPDIYALEQGLSPNTVYAHLRAIKAKCGEGRLAALIRRLQGAVAPARLVDPGPSGG